ncbi:MAG TPA: CDP-diacylglycerol--glycerol-3-phosphate 3-phosphatidyltransferase [Candidatus Corynebacterium gallistercoris]|uniref:CDP-diacylglycerol--glycerol-3-phosphate 3-phosphatidyltransferase n=1 Tax=Candidatus Corynebacterium gallistercoris TaxID=2838530 RepID=A0A9D1RX10_9CORY|nr:CDP-diacylglycerol--glycerol-3-phosphate 3-phosphatidyltransferase [Candidatus Corynebacterium gallistercoris]
MPQKNTPGMQRVSSFGRFVRRFNLPNVLTSVRIALIPVFLWLILTSGGWASGGSDLVHRWWALVAFAALMFTDQLDGFLARKYSVITDFGKLADPIADKALMITALVSLNILGELWWWVTAIIVIRELGITVWRLVLARQGNVVPASRGGKLKTVLQTLAVALFILPVGGIMVWVAAVVMALAVVQTVVTGVQYILDARAAN